MKLAAPMALSSCSWTAMAATDTALIGHTGTIYLTASALSDMWTSSTGVFLDGGVLSVFCS